MIDPLRAARTLPPSWGVTLAAIQKVFPEAVIAGGALRDLIIGRPVKDIDIFIKATGSDDDTHRFLASIYGEAHALNKEDVKEYHEQLSELQGVYSLSRPRETEDDWLSPSREIRDENGCPFQVIALNTEVTPTSVVERMDFGICRVAHDGQHLDATHEFLLDMENQTFTLLRAHSPARSQHRYDRLVREKYQGWRLLDPNNLLDW